MTAIGVVIKQISSNKIDLKVKVDETNEGYTKLNVFASFGYNNWITEKDHPYEFAELRGIIYNFLSEYLPEYHMDKVNESKKNIAKLANKRKDLKEDVMDSEEEIANLKKDNEELMKKLKENQSKINESKSRMIIRNMEYKAIKKKVSKMK